MTLWWRTALIPPDPKSDSLVLFDGQLPSGDHAISVPDRLPTRDRDAKRVNVRHAWFATVQVGAAIYNFSIAAGQ